MLLEAEDPNTYYIGYVKLALMIARTGLPPPRTPTPTNQPPFSKPPPSLILHWPDPY